MSGGGTQTTTEQSQTTYPQWTQDAQANTYGVGKGQLENFLRNPQYSVAGTTTDMLKGMDLARGTAQDVFTAPKLEAPGGGQNLQAAYGTAAQVTPGAIQAGMNPYMSSVIDTTMNSMRRERDNQLASASAKAAAAGSFGGSRGAIEAGQIRRAFSEQAGSTVAQLMAAGYDKATALALSNAQMQQQTGMANQAAENTMRTTGADYGLKATQINDALRNTQLAREQAAAQGITQNGLMQQQQNQRVLDVPWTALERLFGITPKQTNSQTYSEKESPDTSASPLQSIMGLGSTILGAKTAGGGSIAASLLGLSDEREKTDIQKLGKDPETGLQLYSYRYKGDPKTYPKMTGPMAQEVEDAYPGSTRNVGGRMAVPLDMLMNAGKKKGA